MSHVDQSSLAYMHRRALAFSSLPRRERRRHAVRERRKHRRNLPLLYEVLVLLYGRQCAACGSTWDLTVDHILPVSRGGRSVIENLQILCMYCNKRKNREIMDFRPEGF